MNVSKRFRSFKGDRKSYASEPTKNSLISCEFSPYFWKLPKTFMIENVFQERSSGKLFESLVSF